MSIYVCVCVCVVLLHRHTHKDLRRRHEAQFFFHFSASCFPLALTSIPRGSFAYQGRGLKLVRLERVFIVNAGIQLGLRADDGHPGGTEGGGEWWRGLVAGVLGLFVFFGTKIYKD